MRDVDSLMLQLRAVIAAFNIRERMCAAVRANQHGVALGEISGVGCRRHEEFLPAHGSFLFWLWPAEMPLKIMVERVLPLWIILVPVSGLLMSTGQRNGTELADRAPIPCSSGISGQSPNRFPTGSTTSLLFSPCAQRPLGHKVQNAARVVVAREPVLYGGIFYFSIFMDDDFHYRGV